MAFVVSGNADMVELGGMRGRHVAYECGSQWGSGNTALGEDPVNEAHAQTRLPVTV